MAVARNQTRNEKGYVLLSVMLLMTLMLVALSVVLPRISQQIKRDKEEELIHRGQEYARAVRKFYRKFGRYPLSIEQLENTNNMRFLRKRFKDPMTGKDDWRIVHQGEVVQTVPGSGAVSNVNGPSGSGTSSGSASGTGIGSGTGTGSSLGSGTTQNGTGQNSQNSNGFSLGSNPGSSNTSGNSGSAFGNPQVGGGPMVGVASIRKDQSIKILKEKDHYNDWIFYYDPTQEQQQLGGGMNTPNNPNAGQGGQGGPQGPGGQGTTAPPPATVPPRPQQ
ncbi:MAG TPA: hypothetical protein VNV88_12755 [Candidatus Solibacter sp.]|nr:hypothetical protein [Candidatus Solibacter sp.]